MNAAASGANRMQKSSISTPTGMAMAMERARPNPAILRVVGKRSASDVSTGVPERYEVPLSNGTPRMATSTPARSVRCGRRMNVAGCANRGLLPESSCFDFIALSTKH